MAVITEAYLRINYKKGQDKTFNYKKGDIITPSARQYLSDIGVKLISDQAGESLIESQKKSNLDIEKVDNSNQVQQNNVYKYICYETGAHFIEKPEHMTQIIGNQLVAKNHERIVFRGKIDLLLAKIIEMIQLYQKNDKEDLLKDLKELLEWLKKIQRAEILDEPIEQLSFMGLDESSQKKISHNPQKHFGVNHLFDINENTHEVAVKLNVLRAESRTLEIAALDAFYKQRKVERPDLLLMLNRLSSCIYIMMLKAVSGKYDLITKKK